MNVLEDQKKDTKNAVKDIIDVDVWLIGTPIYNSFFSSALKNLFEYVNYKKTEGRVAGIAILASGNIGFIDVQTLITQLLSYFRVITTLKQYFSLQNQSQKMLYQMRMPKKD